MSTAKQVIVNLFASLVVGVLSGLVAYLIGLNLTYMALYLGEGLFNLIYLFSIFVCTPIIVLVALVNAFIIFQTSSETPWYKSNFGKVGIIIWGCFLVFAILTSFPRLANNSKEGRNDTLSPAFTEICDEMKPDGEMPEFVNAQVRGSYDLEFEILNESNLKPIHSFSYFEKNMGPFDIDRFTMAKRVSSRGWTTGDGDIRRGGDLGDAKALVCQYNYLVEHEVKNYENTDNNPRAARIDCSRFLVYVVVLDVKEDEVIAAKQFPYPDDWFSIACPTDGFRLIEKDRLIFTTTGAVELLDEGAEEIGDWLNTVILP